LCLIFTPYFLPTFFTFFQISYYLRHLHSFPTRRSSDLGIKCQGRQNSVTHIAWYPWLIGEVSDLRLGLWGRTAEIVEWAGDIARSRYWGHPLRRSCTRLCDRRGSDTEQGSC